MTCYNKLNSIIRKVIFIINLLLLLSCNEKQRGYSNIDLLQIEIIKDKHSSSLITVIPSSNKYIINNRERVSDNNNNVFLSNFEYISVDSIRMPNIFKFTNDILQENQDTVVCQTTDLMLFNKYPLVVTFNFVYRNESRSYIILVDNLKSSSFNKKEKLLIEIMNNISEYSKDSVNIKYSNEIKKYLKSCECL